MTQPCAAPGRRSTKSSELPPSVAIGSQTGSQTSHGDPASSGGSTPRVRSASAATSSQIRRDSNASRIGSGT
jgi:hypothetical protein